MNLTEDLTTPKALEESKILSRTTQWRERKRGRLKFYLIGRKVFYAPQHLEDFFRKCEKNDCVTKD